MLILPAGDVLSAAAAKKIKEFYDQGGTVIATEQLPTHSSEFGKDQGSAAGHGGHLRRRQG